MPSDPKAPADAGAGALARKAENDNRDGAKRERLDPPVGSDGPDADRTDTVALEDLNSADDE